MNRRGLPREVWHYAALLVLLFAIAAVAVHEAIAFLSDEFGLSARPEQLRLVTGILVALSLGFMSVAGAFGLWTIRLSAGAESRRRIGRFVDAMDYLSDGLLALDARGRVRGANPAAQALLGFDPHHRYLHELLPCLDRQDAARLLRTGPPQEIERRWTSDNEARVLRFRSQPSEGLTLLLISDVTTEEAAKDRQRRLARLQLIGHLARGMAHDFDALLSSIAAQAALVSKQGPPPERGLESVEVIRRQAERGIALANRLLEVSRPTPPETEALPAAAHLQMAVRTLRDTLPEGWEACVQADEEDAAIVTADIPIEQVVVELGLMAAQALSGPGRVTIRLGRSRRGGLFQVPPPWIGALLITAGPASAGRDVPETGLREVQRDSGAVEAVIRHLLEEARGALDHWENAQGIPVFRIRLPAGPAPSSPPGPWEMAAPIDWGRYLAGWRVALAAPPGRHPSLEEQVRRYGATVERVPTLAAALARVQEPSGPDAILIDGTLLAEEASAILKAMIRLRPETALAVIGTAAHPVASALEKEIAFEPPSAAPDRTVRTLIEARRLARRRASPESPPG